MAKEEKKKPSLEATPSKKKKDDKKDLKSKAHMLIMKHPEVMFSARDLFRNENGKTIVEEVVPRGDPDHEDVLMPRTQGDLKDEDLRGLAVFAGELIDATLKAYDPQVALEDALARAIATKDNGKYAGKVNASTFTLILDSMNKKAKKASEEKEAFGDMSDPITKGVIKPVRSGPSVDKEIAEDKRVQEQALKSGITPHGWAMMDSVKKKEYADKMRSQSAPTYVTPKLADTETSKEATMDKAMLQAELDATRAKMAALEVLVGCDEKKEEEASTKEAGKGEMVKCPTCKGKVLKATGYCLSCKKKIDEDGADKPKDKPKDKPADKPKDKKKDKSATQEIIASLDEIAGVLESQKDPELLKVAYQLDLVSDVLDGKKDASCLEGDSDEKFMREYFKAGLREGDSDEKAYMGEFNTDTTTELKNKYPKGLGKDAGEKLPYQVKQ